MLKSSILKLSAALCAVTFALNCQSSFAAPALERAITNDLKHNFWKTPKVVAKKDGYYWKKFKLSSPAEYYEVARSKGLRKTYAVGGKNVIFDFHRLRIDEKSVYDDLEKFERDQKENREYAIQGNPLDYTERTYLPLSLIGPILSYETNELSQPGGGTSSMSTEWQTLDVSTGKTPELTDLLDEKSLLEALSKDRCFVSGLKPEVLTQAKNPAALMKAFIERQNFDNTDCVGLKEFNHFAFVKYDPSKDQVAVRIGFPYSYGSNGWKNSFLGLWVKPKPAFKESLVKLVAQKRGHTSDGFWIGDYKTWR